MISDSLCNSCVRDGYPPEIYHKIACHTLELLFFSEKNNSQVINMTSSFSQVNKYLHDKFSLHKEDTIQTILLIIAEIHSSPRWAWDDIDVDILKTKLLYILLRNGYHSPFIGRLFNTICDKCKEFIFLTTFTTFTTFDESKNNTVYSVFDNYEQNYHITTRKDFIEIDNDYIDKQLISRYHITDDAVTYFIDYYEEQYNDPLFVFSKRNAESDKSIYGRMDNLKLKIMLSKDLSTFKTLIFSITDVSNHICYQIDTLTTLFDIFNETCRTYKSTSNVGNKFMIDDIMKPIYAARDALNNKINRSTKK